MSRHSLLSAVFLLSLSIPHLATAGDEKYKLGPDSQRQEGVPRGKITEHVWRSQVFEGTIRRYWTYVPAQYNAGEEAAVMVFQDGHAYVGESGQFRAPIVLRDQLGMDYAEIAATLDIPPGTVRSRIARGRTRLAERLIGVPDG